MPRYIPKEAEFIGQNLRKIRKMQGLSQVAFAASLGVTAQQVQKYESGQNRFPADKVFLVHRLLNIPLDWFFEGLPRSHSKAAVSGTTPILMRLAEYPDPLYRRKIIKIVEILLS